MARIFIVRSPKDDSWLDEYLKKKEEYIEMEKERPTYSFDVYDTIADFSKAFNTWSTKREKVLEELEALDKREEIARLTIPTTMVGCLPHGERMTNESHSRNSSMPHHYCEPQR